MSVVIKLHKNSKRRFHFSPNICNSATPWATTAQDLKAIYKSQHVGGVTTRTSLLSGFPHNDSIHRFQMTGSFHLPAGKLNKFAKLSAVNSYGYSPHPLAYYIEVYKQLMSLRKIAKIVNISVAGTPDEIQECILQVGAASDEVSAGPAGRQRVAVEVNLSCPNIPNKPPAAFDLERGSGSGLDAYIHAISEAKQRLSRKSLVHVGIKTPPYTDPTRFEKVVDLLAQDPTAVDFITACNTLAPSLYIPYLQDGSEKIKGGLSGAAIHPLALGNVNMFRTLLDKHREKLLRDVVIIGVGGVAERRSYLRMLEAGADAVAVGTGLGAALRRHSMDEAVRRVFAGIRSKEP